MAGRRTAIWVSVMFISLAMMTCFPLLSSGADAAVVTTPIVVQGDAGFDAAEFSGSGTYDDPYLLKGMSVYAEDEYHGIFISNTTKHFRIMDCFVSDAYTPDTTGLSIYASGSGIMLYNVTNGEVVGFTGDYNYRGITVVNSSNVTISSSLFSNCIEAGVAFHGSELCQVYNSTFQRDEVGKHGVLVEDSRTIKVLNNRIYDGATGVLLSGNDGNCTGNLVEGNELLRQSGNAIELGGATPTWGNQVLGNFIRNSTYAGVNIVLGTGETIYGNDIAGCNPGVRIGPGADGNVVSGNLVRDSTFGVYIYPSKDNLVHGNDLAGFLGGASAGIFIGNGAVQDLTITDNVISECTGGIRAIGALGQSVSGLSAVNNTVDGVLGQGLYMQYVENSTVANNSFLNGSGNGVRMVNCRSSSVENNSVVGNGECGLSLQGTFDCLVTGNILLNNVEEGLSIAAGSGNVVHGNAFVFNKASGRTYHPDRAQASCSAEGNQWNLEAGNLWTDWLSPDLDGDGLVDLPYNITGGCQDHFPLTAMPGLDIPEDIVPPTVTEWTPQGTSVAKDSAVRMTFSEDMDNDSVGVEINGLSVNGEWEGRSLALDFTLEYQTDYTITVTGRDLAGNEMSAFEWTFRTEGPDATVTGRIVDEGGGPLSGALIIFDDEEVPTDGDGHFSLVLSPGNHTLLVTAEGFRDAEVLVQVLPGQDMDIGEVGLVREAEASDGLLPMVLGAAAVLGAVLVLWFLRRR